MSTYTALQFVTVEGVRLAYREAGQGQPVVLLHGWPTSSFLWRRMIEPLAATNRVIALDLPGFGSSEKPLDVSYSFRFYEKILSSTLDSLEIDSTSLVVHDLGGPIGLYWASKNQQRLDKLALLNTVVYPQMSWAVKLFVASLKLPGLRRLMTSPWGLRRALELGVADRQRLSADALGNISEPFPLPSDRQALMMAGSRLHPRGFVEIASWLPTITGPVRGIYGERDRILPDIATTMKRLQEDLPQAVVTSLPNCGHFLQEEEPELISRLLAEFLSAA